MQGGALVAGMFFAAAIAMTGLPPLSGFLGKLLILDAAATTPMAAWTWAVVLCSSLVAVVGFSRAGSVIFWKSHQVALAQATSASDPEDSQGAMEPHDPPAAPPALPMVAIGGLLALLVATTVFAGPLNRYLAATSAQLFDPAPYIATVLETPGKEIKDHHDDDHGDSHADAADEGGAAHGTGAATTEDATEGESH